MDFFWGCLFSKSFSLHSSWIFPTATFKLDQTKLPDMFKCIFHGCVPCNTHPLLDRPCMCDGALKTRSLTSGVTFAPSQPKLSSAKCRLNVENFITACRKLGVPEVSLLAGVSPPSPSSPCPVLYMHNVCWYSPVKGRLQCFSMLPHPMLFLTRG